MSLCAHARQAERLRIDRDVRRAYARAAGDPQLHRSFDELARVVRSRSPLLRPIARAPEHDPVTALVHLARERPRYVRPLATWRPEGNSVVPLVHSLASHLLARYPVPRFLASVWFGADDAPARERRAWFRRHGAGRPLRHCIPAAGLTRRMEHRLLTAPHHLPPEAAIRRAEILALGGSPALAAWVGATPLGRRLDRAGFWRSVLEWFVRHEASLDADRVAWIVAFLEEVRHVSTRVFGPEGFRDEGPPMPDFSVQGRSVPALLRLAREWRGALVARARVGRRWPTSGIEGFAYQEGPSGPRWTLVELLDEWSLALEGRRMRHCVGDYVRDCMQRGSSIWSLRCQRPGAVARSILTVEVRMARRSLHTMSARCNEDPRGKPLAIVLRWAAERGLHVPSWWTEDDPAAA